MLPMDFIYLDDEKRNLYAAEVKKQGYFLLVIGLTLTQMLSEAEFNLSVTAAKIEDSEVENRNVTSRLSEKLKA